MEIRGSENKKQLDELIPKSQRLEAVKILNMSDDFFKNLGFSHSNISQLTDYYEIIMIKTGLENGMSDSDMLIITSDNYIFLKKR